MLEKLQASREEFSRTSGQESDDPIGRVLKDQIHTR